MTENKKIFVVSTLFVLIFSWVFVSAIKDMSINFNTPMYMYVEIKTTDVVGRGGSSNTTYCFRSDGTWYNTDRDTYFHIQADNAYLFMVDKDKKQAILTTKVKQYVR